MKERIMPVLFVGHGSPMNAIENNEFSKNWAEITNKIPTPIAILVISAHWYTSGIKVNDSENPNIIYDMYGFPKELYDYKYVAKGSKKYADNIINKISKKVDIDNSWGIDHGAWSVLAHMYPNADIPVLQLSIDRNLNFEDHFRIGKELEQMREEGILILCSGNIVHNLGLVDWSIDGGFDWAYEFDNYIKNNILDKKIDNIINYKKAGKSSDLAFNTYEHFIPLLYALGASDNLDKITVFNDKCVMGSLSMTSYIFE